MSVEESCSGGIRATWGRALKKSTTPVSGVFVVVVEVCVHGRLVDVGCPDRFVPCDKSYYESLWSEGSHEGGSAVVGAVAYNVCVCTADVYMAESDDGWWPSVVYTSTVAGGCLACLDTLGVESGSTLDDSPDSEWSLGWASAAGGGPTVREHVITSNGSGRVMISAYCGDKASCGPDIETCGSAIC